MRRGLISWSREEVPAATLQARVGKLQSAMKRERLDAVLAYTCFSQPSTVSWLTQFVPYWNDGLLVVLPEGDPVMLAAFSKRVQEWIREVSRLGDVMTAPNLGKGAVAFLRERSPALAKGVGRVGIIERDDFPWPALEPLVEAGWGDGLVDATPLYAALRQPADDAEVGLTARAVAMANRALDAMPRGARCVSDLLPAIEAAARGDGAEEVLTRVATDLASSPVLERIETDAALGARYAVQLSLGYKGVWTRETRCLGTGPASWEGGRRWLVDAASKLTPANLAKGPQEAPGEVAQWALEACLGNEPLSVVAAGGASRDFVPRTLPAGALAVVSVQLQTQEGPWHGSAALVLGESRSRVLV